MIMDTETQGRIRNLALDGLYLDGEHHKQWCLEEVLRVIVGEGKMKALFALDPWAKGIAP